MAKVIKAAGAAAVLPVYLQNSGKFAAFICTLKGKILAKNNYFQSVCMPNPAKKATYVKDVFGMYTATQFAECVGLLNLQQHAELNTEVNNSLLCWEFSYYDEGKSLILCLGFIKQAEDMQTTIALEESNFSSFMDNSPALMWATCTQGRLVIVNKKYREVSGLSNNVIGKTLWEVFPKEFADQYKRNDEKVLQYGGLIEMEETSIDRLGHVRDFIVYKFPLQTIDHGLVVAGWSVDITDHKNAHKKLVRQHNRFRQIARLQSHTVRRPLANILGLIDLIQYYSSNGDFTEVSTMIELLKESSNDLDDIIKKIVRKAGIFNPELQVSL